MVYFTLYWSYEEDIHDIDNIFVRSELATVAKEQIVAPTIDDIVNTTVNDHSNRFVGVMPLPIQQELLTTAMQVGAQYDALYAVTQAQAAEHQQETASK